MFEIVFSTIDGWIAFLPAWVRVSVWSLVFGAVTMLLYGWLSPQDRIGAIKEEVEDARREMQNYTGNEFGPVWKMAKRSIGLSFKQLKVMLLPTLIAAAPVISLLIWMEESYTYRLPEPGSSIEATVHPAEAASGSDAEVQWKPTSAVSAAEGDGAFTVQWPSAGNRAEGPSSVRLVDSQRSGTVLELPLDHPRLRMTKYSVWHWFFANPAGYLPASAPVHTVQLDLPYRHVLPWGPGWLRTWRVLFLVMLTISALGVKVGFDID